MQTNPLKRSDSYKAGHFLQYPKGTTGLYAYLCARTGAHYPNTLWFGAQAVVKKLAENPITLAGIDEAECFWRRHGEPFPADDWRYIVNRYDGHYPVGILSAPEGSSIPEGNALMSVYSTDKRVPWVVGWLETQLMRVWYPATVATKSKACKAVIKKHLDATCDSPDDVLPFMLHDFGGRGVSSAEEAEIGAMAHLVNFMGTDTVEGIEAANRYYNIAKPYEMFGYSIPAMEHSTVISWGPDQEEEAYKNAITTAVVAGFKLVACVSDSYDFFRTVEHIWSGSLLPFVKASGVRVVIRPDSGDAVESIVGALNILWARLGNDITVNKKGFKVLPSYYRLIQGDGNNDEADIERILAAVVAAGWSAENVCFGMGGGLLRQVNRDTQRFAYKVSAVEVGGVWRPVSKNPATDPSKKSIGGKPMLYRAGKTYFTADPDGNLLFGQPPADWRDRASAAMGLIYQDGPYGAVGAINVDFNTIRTRSNQE